MWTHATTTRVFAKALIERRRRRRRKERQRTERRILFIFKSRARVLRCSLSRSCCCCYRDQREREREWVFFSSLSCLVCILEDFRGWEKRASEKKKKTQRLAFLLLLLLRFYIHTHTHIHTYILKNGREQKRDAHHAQAPAQAALVLLFDGVRDVLRVPLPKPIGCEWGRRVFFVRVEY